MVDLQISTLVAVLLWVLAIPLIYFLLSPTLATFLYFFKGRKLNRGTHVEIWPDDEVWACIITGYKDVSIALPLVESLNKQRSSHCKIYLVADGVPNEGVEMFQGKPNLILLQPEKGLNSKVKSLQYAIDHFQEPHPVLVVFDPDNVAHPNCLATLRNAMHQGFAFVQGRRTAKNRDSGIASLDGLGEAYYNFTRREVPVVLGGSASIAGSGMAVETELFKLLLSQPEIQADVVPAEDKFFQGYLVRHGYKIGYEPKSITYDEKVSEAGQLQRQRTRWMYSYFLHLKDGFAVLKTTLKQFALWKIYFALDLLALPMVLLLAGTLFLMLFSVLFNWAVSLTLLASLLVFVAHFIWVAKRNGYSVGLLFGSVPAFAFRQILALLSMKKAAKSFMHTQNKKVVSVEDLIPEEERLTEPDSNQIKAND